MGGLLGLNLESFAADGTPDTTFSTNIGSGFNNIVNAVAVQSDGKIVVGGQFTTINGAGSNRIARLNADGTPDTTFSTNIGSGFDSDAYGVAIQSDGKIIVGGYFTTINGTPSSYIARLNADGTPDTTFSTNIGSGFDSDAYGVAIQSDGKIVVGGAFTSINGTGSNRIARLNVPTTPTATTSAASSVTATGATLNGTVNDNGASTTVTFNYGTTVSYGSTATAAQSPISAGTGSTSVTAALTGLTCNTLYHYRVSATNNVNTTNGSDATFTTAACPTYTIELCSKVVDEQLMEAAYS